MGRAKETITVDGVKYKKVNSKVTLVNFILDMSGSMGVVWDSTINGFNEYIDNLKKDGNEYRVSVTLFDDVIEQLYTNVPIDEVKHLTRETYAPRGFTALYDAVCSTINKVKGDITAKDKSLVVIMTDGGENASQKYNQQSLTKLKKELDAKKNWTFVFLGANQDAWGTASQWGFSAQNVATYNSTDKGTHAAFRGMSLATSMYAASASSSTDAFMSVEQKKNIEETK